MFNIQPELDLTNHVQAALYALHDRTTTLVQPDILFLYIICSYSFQHSANCFLFRCPYSIHMEQRAN